MSKERKVKLDLIGFMWGSKQNVRWEIMFDELEKFKDCEGHCDVPFNSMDNPKLGRWVGKQREHKSIMSKERKLNLESIGFTWCSKQKSKQNDEKWDVMFYELEKFKASEGHCNVPHNNRENLKLGKWVCKQVSTNISIWPILLNQQVRCQRGKKLSMSKERKAKLESIGFIWWSKQSQQNDERWNLMFHELKQFKNREGRCNVRHTDPDTQKLGRWVSKQ